MNTHWADTLRNPEKLLELYRTPPRGDVLRIHSLHLNRRGPTLTLRASLPQQAGRLREDRTEPGCDTVEFHLQFLDVADVRVTGGRLPADAAVAITELRESRIAVRIDGGPTDIAFTGNRAVSVGRLSTRAATPDGSSPVHHYTGRVDALRYSAPPATWEENYYARV
ncbi:hypothetical protein ACFV4M_21390 [Kitasatospora indigofera]|uniref:hypothetical protein n=1 Tax=Kitasatospora indigofera TaxID=67307 RepID=UPI003648DB07